MYNQEFRTLAGIPPVTIRDPQRIDAWLEKNLPFMDHPEIYATHGDEINSVHRDWDKASFRVCLVGGMAYRNSVGNLAIPLVYSEITEKGPQDWFVDRSYLWESRKNFLMFKRDTVPPIGLQSHRSLADFDAVMFSCSYLQTILHVPLLLKYAGVPWYSDQRTDQHPLVVVGGHHMYVNPEPIWRVMDVGFVGEFSAGGLAMIKSFAEAKAKGIPKWEWMERYRKDGDKPRPGFYVPMFFKETYSKVAPYPIASKEPIFPDMEKVVPKAYISNLDLHAHINEKPLVSFMNPAMGTAEVQSSFGCDTATCTFCSEGQTNKPFRFYSVSRLVRALKNMMRNSGMKDVTLSAFDGAGHPQKRLLIRRLLEEVSDNVSLLSLRVDEMADDDLFTVVSTAAGNKTISMGVEGMSERMRIVYNKWPLVAGTLIPTTRGLIGIEEILQGDEVVTRVGQFPVESVMKDTVTEVVRIGLTDGTVISADGRHPFLVGNKWVETKDLKLGDEFTQVYGTEAGGGKPSLWGVEIDTHLAYLLGFLVGDGNVELNNGVRILVKKDSYEWDRLQNILSAKRIVFSTHFHMNSSDGEIWNIHLSRARAKEIIDVGGKWQLHRLVFQGAAEIRASFIAGLYAADGTISTRGAWSLTQSHPGFLQDIKSALTDLGISTTLGFYDYPKHHNEVLIVRGGQDRQVFDDKISVHMTFHREQKISDALSRPRPTVKSLETVYGETDVYCLTVPGVEEFVANGVVSHNCSEAQILKVCRKAMASGATKIKFFMICNHPWETESDRLEWIESLKKIEAIKNELGSKCQLLTSWTPLVIMPWTPLQWEAPTPDDRTLTGMINAIKAETKTDFRIGSGGRRDEAYMAQLMQLGDRRLDVLIDWCVNNDFVHYGATSKGTKEKIDTILASVPGYEEPLGFHTWFRTKPYSEILPWNHIGVGVSREWLVLVNEISKLGQQQIPTCVQQCSACGACTDEDRVKMAAGHLLKDDDFELKELNVIRQRGTSHVVRMKVSTDFKHRFIGSDYWEAGIRRAFFQADLPIDKTRVRAVTDRYAFYDYTHGIDYVDVGMMERVKPTEVHRIQEFLPNGMRLIASRGYSPHVKLFRLTVGSVHFVVHPNSVIPKAEAKEALERMLGAKEFVAKIKQKVYRKGIVSVPTNVRSWIKDAWLTKDGAIHLETGGKVNPFELLPAMLMSSRRRVLPLDVERLDCYLADSQEDQEDAFRPFCPVTGKKVEADMFDEVHSSGLSAVARYECIPLDIKHQETVVVEEEEAEDTELESELVASQDLFEEQMAEELALETMGRDSM